MDELLGMLNAELTRSLLLERGRNQVRWLHPQHRLLAAEEDSPLTQDHLERTVRAEFREGGKLAESGLLE